uniref:Cytochrome c oxidase subunit 3 n=1 Tax=Columbicola macrourae TaxID=128993 RepID=A0A6G7SJY8_9NEOP|nr:cytochrome oxidase subunit 3 [Columbicola macrourae]
MFVKGFHPFHIVDPSPWPLLGSLSLMSLVFFTFSMFVDPQKGSFLWWVISICSLSMVVYQWWRDVSRESSYQGHHSNKAVKGLKLGMIMFILSEIMFFFSFFFGFFFFSLNPDVEMGMKWPPEGVESLSFLSVPMLNTILLLSSGVSITWAHHGLISSNMSTAMSGLMWTISLGVIFTLFQMTEYLECNFTIADSVFGSVFYIATGFHGIHVLVGTIFIITSTIRILLLLMTNKNHLGFEMSAWYWHFVDVVWLFLFITIYWWGA